MRGKVMLKVRETVMTMATAMAMVTAMAMTKKMKLIATMRQRNSKELEQGSMTTGALMDLTDLVRSSMKVRVLEVEQSSTMVLVRSSKTRALGLRQSSMMVQLMGLMTSLTTVRALELQQSLKAWTRK